MEDDNNNEKNQLRKDVGVKILSQSLGIFKTFNLLGNPDEIFSIWFGVSKSLIEMLLTNIHDININKFKTVKANVLNQIEALKKAIGQIDTPTRDMYG